jgi:hypothetical protein
MNNHSIEALGPGRRYRNMKLLGERKKWGLIWPQTTMKKQEKDDGMLYWSYVNVLLPYIPPFLTSLLGPTGQYNVI